MLLLATLRYLKDSSAHIDKKNSLSIHYIIITEDATACGGTAPPPGRTTAVHPHPHQDVDPLHGLMANGVTMKTTMLIAIMMVELAASTAFQV